VAIRPAITHRSSWFGASGGFVPRFARRNGAIIVGNRPLLTEEEFHTWRDKIHPREIRLQTLFVALADVLAEDALELANRGFLVPLTEAKKMTEALIEGKESDDRPF
jgi:hypothetical protein